jgi:hypothetical protein
LASKTHRSVGQPAELLKAEHGTFMHEPGVPAPEGWYHLQTGSRTLQVAESFTRKHIMPWHRFCSAWNMQRHFGHVVPSKAPQGASRHRFVLALKLQDGFMVQSLALVYWPHGL